MVTCRVGRFVVAAAAVTMASITAVVIVTPSVVIAGFVPFAGSPAGSSAGLPTTTAAAVTPELNDQNGFGLGGPGKTGQGLLLLILVEVIVGRFFVDHFLDRRVGQGENLPILWSCWHSSGGVAGNGEQKT